MADYEGAPYEDGESPPHRSYNGERRREVFTLFVFFFGFFCLRLGCLVLR